MEQTKGWGVRFIEDLMCGQGQVLYSQGPGGRGKYD